MRRAEDRAPTAPGRTSSSSGSAPSASRRKIRRQVSRRVRVGRVDRDTIRSRGAIAALLSRFAGGEIDVLVGTQMIAKGHDFPRVTLVGVICADVGLGLADFRAAERTFQLLTQVAGRAGRGEIAGRSDRADALSEALQHPPRVPPGLRARSTTTRSRSGEAMQYPPAVALINVVVKARTREEAMEDAGEIVNALRIRRRGLSRARPGARAARAGCRGEHRAQLFIKGTHRPAMRQALQRSCRRAPGAPAQDDRRRRSDERAVTAVPSAG